MNDTRDADRDVVKLRPNPGAIWRLFCLPYAGGGAQIFRGWPSTLPVTVEVCAVELPGRGMRLQEPLYTRLPLLVEAIVFSLTKHLDKPFAFFGHSMGALLSFEIARALRRQHMPGPVHLFVSGRGAPQIPRQEQPLSTLPDSALLHELRRLNGTPQEILGNAELMQLMLPILRADFAICDTYHYTPEPPLACPITAFGGLQDASVTVKHLEAWRTQTRATYSVQLLPGDHFFLQTHQALFLQTLARELHQWRQRA